MLDIKKVISCWLLAFMKIIVKGGSVFQCECVNKIFKRADKKLVREKLGLTSSFGKEKYN